MSPIIDHERVEIRPSRQPAAISLDHQQPAVVYQQNTTGVIWLVLDGTRHTIVQH